MMIRTGMRYAYPIALVRSLLGKLLRPQDYAVLLHVDSREQMLAHLHTTTYGSAITETRAKSDAFPLALFEHFFSTAQKVISALPRLAQDLCRTFLLHLEIEVLKVFLRVVGEQTERSALLPLLYPLPANSSLSLERLLAATNLSEIAEALVGTPYAEPVREEIHNLPSSRSLFSLEVRLDRWFFTRLFAAAAPFTGRERGIVQHFLGTLADVTNILWAQRLRTTFHFSAEETHSFLLPYGCYLTERRRQVVATWDGTGPLPVAFPGTEERPVSLRLSLLRTLCREARKPLVAIPFQAGVPLAYLFLAEMEIADLTTLWEGRRWPVAVAELGDRLIRFHGAAVLEATHV